jgi:hypothetical protein
MLTRIEGIEQALGIKRAAGPGDGDENFQVGRKYDRGPEMRQACS